ncbi:MAG: UDP-N-acetylglucosamine 1-carboxyvinyltransferase [Clostridia bacterium]|nr:UDP-N-acetylglucosamine 1-carboxyvinyltransferase [Clostridia bacterium]
MNCYKIEGGRPLFGTVDIHGSKNAALPILVATVINGGKSVIHNCPELSDVESIIDILKLLGCKVLREKSDVYVDSSGFRYRDIPLCEMKRTRSSTMFAGALLARCRKAFIAGSGGCCIGKRPIDIHLKAFQCMGVDICSSVAGVECMLRHPKPGKIMLDFPSVGATENIMLLASSLKGKTHIINAAREPEIVNLADYLRSTGVKINGDGTGTITIEGTYCPRDGKVTVMPDRIVAATYMSAVASAGGKVCMCGINPRYLSSVIAHYRKMGLEITCRIDSFEVARVRRCANVPYISTAPYPGFPTDCQPLAISVMALSENKGTVCERIFENRFSHCIQLSKMGANIDIHGRNITVRGVPFLRGCNLVASDLRCGAALAVAALGAHGTSYIYGVEYIDRGYEDLCRDLYILGAQIERIE